MLKGTRLLTGEDAKVYSNTIGVLKELLHQ